MIFTETRLKGLFVVEPERFEDERGFFAETFSQPQFEQHGLTARVAQCNLAYNHRRGTLRGMHFQLPPHAQAKLVRVPGKWAMRVVLQFLWKRGISAIPPEALPYMTGEYIMNTDRLRKFLGAEYESVMRYTIADAFADSFKNVPVVAQSASAT